MSALLRQIFLFVVILFTSASGYAKEPQLAEQELAEHNKVQIELLSEESAIAPATTFYVLAHFKLQPGWHLYWENPGDAGAPPKITWNLPDGFYAEDPLFPTPQRFTVASAVGFGYEGEFSLLIPIRAASSIIPGHETTLSATISYVACKESCIPATWNGSITLPVAKESTKNSDVTTLFTQAREQIPQNAPKISASIQGNKVKITIPFDRTTAPIKAVQFFPKLMDIINILVNPKWKMTQDGADAVVSLDLSDNAPDEIPVSGVLVITFDSGKKLSLSINSTLKKPKKPLIPSSKYQEQKEPKKAEETPATMPTEPSPQEGVTIPQAKAFVEKEMEEIKKLMNKDFASILLLAFVGGLILNVMPCVLPVISIKLIHYIKMRGQSYLTQLKHGVSFSLGILLSFWILAAIIFALQAAGKTVGWGFQLQEPLFVATLIIIVFILSMSLFGVFEFGVKIASIAADVEEGVKSGMPHAESIPSLWASFLSGILATLVASPCTGPLLGSALGFTATLDPAFAFLIFTALGLGMAFPYLFLSLFPGFAFLIPRPGKWMVTFKQFMGFLMMATVLWLVWVLEAEVTNLSLAILFSSFFSMGFGLWIYGTWGGVDRKRFIRALGRFFSLFFIVFGSYLLIDHVYTLRLGAQRSAAQDQEIQTQERTTSGSWKPYSRETLQQLRGKQIVFVNFTAKWCLTCQANKVVLMSKGVQEAFLKHNVALLLADWTDGNEELTKDMRALGRNGVPVYAVYPKEANSQPIVLPELLTPEVVIDTIEKISKQ